MLLSYIAVGIVGILVGGLVNALADDLPQRRRPSRPVYPDGTPRPVSAWLGLTAFLTGQRTGPSGASLSWRYPLTELCVSALMLLTVALTINDPEVSDLQRVFYLFYMALFVLITIIDLEHRLILFVVVIPAAAIAVLDAILTPINHKPDLGTALLGGLLGFSVFFILFLGGILFSYLVSKIRGEALTEVAFGYGDVMLSTLCGLILGWQATVIAMFLTVFIGAVGSVAYLLIRSFSGRYNMFTPLPYGQYIVIGTLILLLFPDQVQQILWSVTY
jgi:prepilin signal peptidase PulO-like enzyme (type II secretory pathway)